MAVDEFAVSVEGENALVEIIDVLNRRKKTKKMLSIAQLMPATQLVAELSGIQLRDYH